MGKESIILERRFIPGGTVIVRQGEPGNCAYLVQSGTVRVTTKNKEQDIELARLGVGEIFGEMALIFDEPRTATVTSMEDCNLIILTRQTFRAKLDRSDPTVRAIVEMLVKRVNAGNKTVINKKSSMKDLTETVKVIYENVYAELKQSQKRTFQNGVKPKLDDFINAVRSFNERYK